MVLELSAPLNKIVTGAKEKNKLIYGVWKMNYAIDDMKKFFNDFLASTKSLNASKIKFLFIRWSKSMFKIRFKISLLLWQTLRFRFIFQTDFVRGKSRSNTYSRITLRFILF